MFRKKTQDKIIKKKHVNSECDVQVVFKIQFYYSFFN